MFTYPRFFFVAAVAAMSVSLVYGADLQRQAESPCSDDAGVVAHIKKLIMSSPCTGRQKLLTGVIRCQQSPRRGQECVICLQALKSDEPDMHDETVCQLSEPCICPNKYHTSCINAWFETSKTCPICYTKVQGTEPVCDQDGPVTELQVATVRKELVILLPDGKLNN